MNVHDEEPSGNAYTEDDRPSGTPTHMHGHFQNAHAPASEAKQVIIQLIIFGLLEKQLRREAFQLGCC